MDLNSLLENIYNDISFTEDELDNLKQSTNKFIENELEKINKYLNKSVMDFTKNEIENLKKSKIDLLHKNINTITESVLIKVAEEYDLDQDEVLENNKINLLEINNFNNLYSDTNNDKILEVCINDSEQNTTEQSTTEQSTTEQNTTEQSNIKENDKRNTNTQNKSKNTSVKKSIKLDSTTENDVYKKHLIEQKKCPLFKSGKYCEKVAKHGNYCGYHKKFNI